MGYTAKILNLHQAHVVTEKDAKDKDGVVIPGKKTQGRGDKIKDTFHVQAGVLDPSGCLKYSLSDTAKENPTAKDKNTLLKKVSNEYKATLQKAGEPVPDIDIQLQE